MTFTIKPMDILTQKLGRLILRPGCFHELPFEVVSCMASFMDLKTIRAFRLSNKYAAECAQFHFRENYLRVLRTDFSKADFATIQQRLADPAYLAAVDTLSISAKVKKWEEPLRCSALEMGTGFSWKRPAHSRWLLDLEQPVVRQWQELFRRLVNLKHIRINTDLKGTHCLPPREDAPPEEFTLWDAFAVTMPFVRRSGLPIISLEISGLNLCQGEDDEEREAIDALFLSSPASVAWPHLESFTLDFTGNGGNPTRFGHLLAGAPNLKRLSLVRAGVESNLRELARYADTFKLEELHLEDGECHLQALGPVLTQHRDTLTKLTLSDMGLDNWKNVFEFLRDGGFAKLHEFTVEECTEESRDWKRLYFPYSEADQLLTAPPGAKLSYTMIQRLTKRASMAERLLPKDHAANIAKEYEHIYSAITYLGSGMDSVFGQLADKVVVATQWYGAEPIRGVYEF